MSAAYNVTEDRREWAYVKAGLLSPEDRLYLMEELMRRDQQAAARIMGSIISGQHGPRVQRRQRVSYP